MAIARDAGAKAQIKLRLKEPLRAKLAAEAQQNEVSLNTEIVQRLNTSLNEEAMGGAVFGSRDVFVCASIVARFVKMLEKKWNTKVSEDPHLFPEALRAAAVHWKMICTKIADVTSGSEKIDQIDMEDLLENWQVAATSCDKQDA